MFVAIIGSAADICCNLCSDSHYSSFLLLLPISAFILAFLNSKPLDVFCHWKRTVSSFLEATNRVDGKHTFRFVGIRCNWYFISSSHLLSSTKLFKQCSILCPAFSAWMARRNVTSLHKRKFVQTGSSHTLPIKGHTLGFVIPLPSLGSPRVSTALFLHWYKCQCWQTRLLRNSSRDQMEYGFIRSASAKEQFLHWRRTRIDSDGLLSGYYSKSGTAFTRWEEVFVEIYPSLVRTIRSRVFHLYFWNAATPTV